MEPGMGVRQLTQSPRFMVHSARITVLVWLAMALTCCVHAATPLAERQRMEDLLDVRNISISIHRSPANVYAFVSDGNNLPRWATGLGRSVRSVNGEWLANGPLGLIRIRFTPVNDLGVLDHDVALESGVTVHNPMRVVPNGAAGSTVIFTLLHLPGVSAAKFEEDSQWVQRDLTTLKGLLEAVQ